MDKPVFIRVGRFVDDEATPPRECIRADIWCGDEWKNVSIEVKHAHSMLPFWSLVGEIAEGLSNVA